MSDLMTSPPGRGEPAGPVCDLDGCDVHVGVNERGRPRRFCSDAHARQWHNAHRSTGRAQPTPSPGAGGAETADAWTLLMQVGEQLPRLVKEIRAERQQLEPDSVRARLAEAEAAARRAAERAHTAERDAAQ